MASRCFTWSVASRSAKTASKQDKPRSGINQSSKIKGADHKAVQPKHSGGFAAELAKAFLPELPDLLAGTPFDASMQCSKLHQGVLLRGYTKTHKNTLLGTDSDQRLCCTKSDDFSTKRGLQQRIHIDRNGGVVHWVLA